MDKTSFISSFSGFRQIPAAAMLATGLFALSECGVTLLWRPDVVGERLYAALSPSYDYGYGSDVPRLFAERDDWRFYPTEYVNIRPFSIRRSKPDDEVRIFVLGGSVSRGSGLREGADYGSQLERALQERLPQYDWNVINLSADGFGTSRMVRILFHMLSHRPDAIIVHPHGTNEYEDLRDAGYRNDLRTGISGLLLRSSLLVLLQKAEMFTLRLGSRLPSVEDERSASLHPENVAHWQEVFATNIERIDCMSRKLGIPAIYVGRAERDAPAFRNDRVDRLNEPIRRKPLYVDAAAALARELAEHPQAALWYDNTHYTEVGHAVIAGELLQRFLPEGRVLDRPVSRPAATTPRPQEIAARCGLLRLIKGDLGD